MTIPQKTNRNWVTYLFVFFIIVILIDRYYWAQVSQWREDQSTNMWLGYTHGLTDIPVGLMSSYGIPNPNGMVIWGYFFSFLPDFLSVSFLLGLIQIGLILSIGFVASKENRTLLPLLVVPSLTSVILSSTSIEFWNQYVLTSINLLFLLLALKYLEKPSLWLIPQMIIMICIPPSLYLGGLVNSVVITLMTIGLLFYKKPPAMKLIPIIAVSITVILLSVTLTWIPYFQAMDLQTILSVRQSNPSFIGNFKSALESITSFPTYLMFQWADRTNFNAAIKHSNANVLAVTTNVLLKLVAHIYLVQSIFAFMAVTYGILKGKSDNHEFNLRYDPSAAKVISLSALFLCASYTFSILLGGPAWSTNIRQDQIVQFLPMCLFIVFTLPYLFILDGKIGSLICRIGFLSMFLFSTVNLICGSMVIHDHLAYRGNAVTEADVPLADKMRVVDFIAEDWGNHSDSTIIPVDYKLGGGKWEWIPQFGLSIIKWYPTAAFTEGRGFDYLLKREYGLTNYQEGTQLRTFGTGRYLVTYTYEDQPYKIVPIKNYTEFTFGRLRVTVVDR